MPCFESVCSAVAVGLYSSAARNALLRHGVGADVFSFTLSNSGHCTILHSSLKFCKKKKGILDVSQWVEEADDGDGTPDCRYVHASCVLSMPAQLLLRLLLQ